MNDDEFGIPSVVIGGSALNNNFVPSSSKYSVAGMRPPPASPNSMSDLDILGGEGRTSTRVLRDKYADFSVESILFRTLANDLRLAVDEEMPEEDIVSALAIIFTFFKDRSLTSKFSGFIGRLNMLANARIDVDECLKDYKKLDFMGNDTYQDIITAKKTYLHNNICNQKFDLDTFVRLQSHSGSIVQTTPVLDLAALQRTLYDPALFAEPDYMEVVEERKPEPSIDQLKKEEAVLEPLKKKHTIDNGLETVRRIHLMAVSGRSVNGKDIAIDPEHTAFTPLQYAGWASSCAGQMAKTTVANVTSFHTKLMDGADKITPEHLNPKYAPESTKPYPVELTAAHNMLSQEMRALAESLRTPDAMMKMHSVLRSYTGKEFDLDTSFRERPTLRAIAKDVVSGLSDIGNFNTCKKWFSPVMLAGFAPKAIAYGHGHIGNHWQNLLDCSGVTLVADDIFQFHPKQFGGIDTNKRPDVWLKVVAQEIDNLSQGAVLPRSPINKMELEKVIEFLHLIKNEKLRFRYPVLLSDVYIDTKPDSGGDSRTRSQKISSQVVLARHYVHLMQQHPDIIYMFKFFPECTTDTKSALTYTTILQGIPEDRCVMFPLHSRPHNGERIVCVFPRGEFQDNFLDPTLALGFRAKILGLLQLKPYLWKHSSIPTLENAFIGTMRLANALRNLGLIYGGMSLNYLSSMDMRSFPFAPRSEIPAIEKGPTQYIDVQNPSVTQMQLEYAKPLTSEEIEEQRLAETKYKEDLALYNATRVATKYARQNAITTPDPILGKKMTKGNTIGYVAPVPKNPGLKKPKKPNFSRKMVSVIATGLKSTAED